MTSVGMLRSQAGMAIVGRRKQDKANKRLLLSKVVLLFSHLPPRGSTSV